MSQQGFVWAKKQTQSSTLILQRKCDKCDEKKSILERTEAHSASVPPVVHEVLRSTGASLDAATQDFMEPRFGHDFSRVRVHADARAEESARAVNARAYTVGQHVVFGAGNYVPHNHEGQRLLAHELTHVAQQASSNPAIPQDIKIAGDNISEREANASASRISRGQGPVLSAVNTLEPSLQRQPDTIDVDLTPVSPKEVDELKKKGITLPSVSEKTYKAIGGTALNVIGHGAKASAIKLARERMTEVLGGLKAPGETQLKGTSVELHIIPSDKKLTDLPEFASLKGVKTFDGRNYDDLRGVGGTKIGSDIRYAIAEEQLISVSGKPSVYSKGFVAAHESGHIVEQFGLTEDQKKALQKAYDARKKADGPWLSPKDYTSTSTGEYFAQSVAAYFSHPYSDSKEDKSMYTKEWLKKNDPEMHKLLASIYS